MTELAIRTLNVSRRLLLGLSLLGIAGCVQGMLDAPPRSVVFFTAFSADLDATAQQVIDQVVLDAKANPARRVVVEGFADRNGSAAANKTLSELRAQVVADALVSHGIERNRVTLHPRGATMADPGIESRRVDITFGS